MQTSGRSCRENANAHLPFEILIEKQVSSSRTSEHSERRSGTHTPRRSLLSALVDGFLSTTRVGDYGSRLKAGTTSREG
jgi:hypothetical protein